MVARIANSAWQLVSGRAEAESVLFADDVIAGIGQHKTSFPERARRQRSSEGALPRSAGEASAGRRLGW